ncbi:MAG: alpha/beta fold hydrolase [Pseudomonadaceae bacterium]|nr:MAG: alpha/beta fold hydrolase [Pseudomonadaceae bacterium]
MTDLSRTGITLLPGWALDAASMQPLRQALSAALPGATIALANLPALRMAELEPGLTEWAEQLQPGLLVGWSLGGMLALQLQRRFPERFPAVVTLASNACFVQRKDWLPAMPAATWKQFYADFCDQPEKTLKRFALLVSQGSEDARALARALPWDQHNIEQRLHLLALLGVLDNRAFLKRATAPVLHCLGAADALVPADAVEALRTLDPAARICQHPAAGHALALDQPDWVAAHIVEFMESLDV